MMTLREMIVERILYCVTEKDLNDTFMVTVDELPTLSDVDLMELYDDVMMETM